ncbi:uncharacterized protein [Spinacia oleracea]|uniref:Retrotransposon Copia-like N-terminal domain-containing protein n=1 Tax=Spinacia oleracea TaxID=3562 RepID=A0ABM3R0Q8_SPIOL|nr:uncharacterized protein LOC130463934 [Spinacia oleracea]
MSSDEEAPPKVIAAAVDLDYYLGSGDGPGIVITPVKLRGASNYDEWAKAVRRSIISKFKFGFLDGSVKEPVTDATKMKHWIAVNSMVVSWITNTIDESLSSNLEDFDIAHELRSHLRTRYCVVTGTRVCHIKMALSGCKQGTSEGVMEYYGRLSKVWKEYVQYARVPRCIYAGCTCNIAKQVGDIHDEDRLHYFLIGLDDHYEAIRAQLLARSPLLGLDEAYQTVMNTETMRAKATRGTESVMAFKVETKGRSRSGDASDRFCGHCNREGHEEETCYQLIGFPEWWDEKKRGGRGPGRGGRTSIRGGRGARRAASSTSGVARANAVSNTTGGATATVTSGGGSQGVVTTTNHELVGVTKEQVQQIVDILSRPPNKLQGPLDEDGDWRG